MTSLAPLRPHQAQSLDSLRDALRSGYRRVVLSAPTGMGKTVLAAHIVAGVRSRAKRITFCVPTIGLVDQTFDRFVENGIDASDMGVIQADHPWKRPHAPIQIATAQTLTRRELPISDVVVVDECHIRNAIYERWMAEQPGLIFIGLSATPWAKGMGRTWQRVVKSISLSELISQGYLSPFRVFAPSHPDLVGVKTVAGDYHEGQLSERMNRPQLVADIVETWINRGEDRPTLCFATGRNHAKAIHERFGEFGVSVAYVDADTPRQERERIGRRLAAGEVKVVVNIGTLTTGIDWDVRCIILARPTKSEMLFCLDAETEILTSHGWRGMGEIKVGDCVASCDGTNASAGRWSLVTGVVERDMDQSESWIEYDAPRANFRVTDRHRMLFRSCGESEYRVAEAHEMLAIKGSCYVPTAVSIDQPGVPLTDAELYFIGMMMTDGTWTATAGNISQSERHPDIIERIEKCLAGCGIGYSKTRVKPAASVGALAICERHPRWVYSISAGKPKPHGNLGRGPIPTKRAGQQVRGVTGYRHLLPYLDKDFAPALMALSRMQFKTLLSGMFDGDGSKKAGRPWCDYTPRSIEICSARKMVVDRLQALAAIHGMTANLRVEDGASRAKPIYFITITEKSWRSCGGYSSTGRNGGMPRNKRPQIERRQATSERVWCVQSEAGTIVTRRRGKVTVMGNCQIVGRGLRTAPGKQDLLLLDHSDTHERLGFVTDIGRDELDCSKPGKSKAEAKDGERKVPLPTCCPSCTALMPAGERVCGACGSELPLRVNVEVMAGELTEFKGRGQPRKRDVLAEMPKAVVYAQLMTIQRERGRSTGWLAHAYRDIFGVWPRGLGDTVPAPVSFEVAQFVRHKDIAFAKSRSKQRDMEANHGAA